MLRSMTATTRRVAVARVRRPVRVARQQPDAEAVVAALVLPLRVAPAVQLGAA